MKNIESEVRLVRGGSWRGDSWDGRAVNRDWEFSGDRFNILGFRVVHRRRKP